MEERQRPLNPGGIEVILGVQSNWMDSNAGTVATHVTSAASRDIGFDP
jgi:hypothetical protein